MAKGSFRMRGKVVWPGFTEIEPRHVEKVGRNDPCPCGSGRKFKDCHERAGSAYLEKLARERDRERMRAARASAAAAVQHRGRRWWDRLLFWRS